MTTKMNNIHVLNKRVYNTLVAVKIKTFVSNFSFCCGLFYWSLLEMISMPLPETWFTGSSARL